MTVLVRHEPGCKWAREGTTAEIGTDGTVTGYRVGQGHSDAAKRFSDTYNLHRAAGITSGWIAVRYADGSGGDDVFDTREDAVRTCWPYEDWYFYATLAAAPSMSVCAAASMLRWKRIMSDVERPDRDYPDGGLEVIPYLTEEDRAQQESNVRSGRGLVAMASRLFGNRRS